MNNVQQHAQLSGLVFTNLHSNSGEEEQDDPTPQWQTAPWPPMPMDLDDGHASIVIHQPDNQGRILVVMGGCWLNEFTFTYGVLWVNLDYDEDETTTMAWREAPSMNEKRHYAAAVVCNGSLYAIGGQQTADTRNGHQVLDTIEKIDINDLQWSDKNDTIACWKTLECRLSSGKWGHAAAVVQGRFIVVAGGSAVEKALASVDILDTCSESQCVIISGPPLNVARRNFGMGVVGQRVYVVGGMGGEELDYMDSVEYLNFDDWSKNKGPQNATSALPFTNQFWKMHKDLVLGNARHGHGMVRVGSCLVVVGGEGDEDKYMCSVEVLDTKRNLVWQLPGRFMCSVVAISNGIATIEGCEEENVVETLPLVDKNSVCFARMMTLDKAPLRI